MRHVAFMREMIRVTGIYILIAEGKKSVRWHRYERKDNTKIELKSCVFGIKRWIQLPEYRTNNAFLQT